MNERLILEQAIRQCKPGQVVLVKEADLEFAFSVWDREKLMAVGDVTSNERGSGARFNDGKVRYDLIPTHLLESTANVLEYGANKYAPYNWAKGMPFSVVIGCLKRHLAAIERGEDIDAETGQRHTGHLMCNLLFLEHYMNEYPEMDDRPKEWFGKGKVVVTGETPTSMSPCDGWVDTSAKPYMPKTLAEQIGAIKKETDDRLRTHDDDQRAISAAAIHNPRDAVVNGGVSDVRTDVQPADEGITFIYADHFGVEYWRKSDGGVVRYDRSGSKLD